MDKTNLEMEILSAVMLDFNLVDSFLAKLKQSDFTDLRHQYLYKVFERLSQQNVEEFSLSDVYSLMPKAIDVCGGVDYLVDILNTAVTTSTFHKNIKALIQMNCIQTIQKLGVNATKIFDEGFDKGFTTVLNTLESLSDRVAVNKPENYFNIFSDSLTSTSVNVDLGFKKVHDILGYPHPGELLIIGARPGMGKTAFALACLFNYVCQQKKKAVMFSLEMSGSELFQRMISSISAIPLSDIRNHSLTEPMKKCLLDNAKELESNKYLVLHDKAVSTISMLRSVLRQQRKTGEIGIVVIDYLQLLSGSGNSNYEKVSEISRQLKLLARDFNCCVIALSQLSRKVEERADKHPQLSDLRESGSIEQDADYVIFLYRHNYYVKDPSVSPDKETIEVNIAKNRHGKVGTATLDVDLTTGRFLND